MSNTRTSGKEPKDLDRLGRRSRFKRVRTGKRLVLGERDIEILRWLQRYRYLRHSHLLDILQPKSEKRFIERLGDLYHETGFINRPEPAGAAFVLRGEPMLYELTPDGIRYLAAINRLPNRAVNFSLRPGRAKQPNLQHTMMIVEALLDVELQAISEPGRRFVPLDEILLKAPEATRMAANPLAVAVTIEPGNGHVKVQYPKTIHIVPDGLYGIEYRINGENRYRFWALECDRTTPAYRATTGSTSLALKRAAYEAMIRSGAFRAHWGIPNLKLQLVQADAGKALDENQDLVSRQ